MYTYKFYLNNFVVQASVHDLGKNEYIGTIKDIGPEDLDDLIYLMQTSVNLTLETLANMQHAKEPKGQSN